MAGAPLLSFYLALTHVAGGAWWLAQRLRIGSGKEDPARLGERRGIAGLPRPDGRLLWLHAASVGETQALLGLIARLLDDHADLRILVTSTTRTSATLLARDLPDRAVHQYPPADTPQAARAFLRHWRPDAAVFAESELWPRLLAETRGAGVPLLLVNARISERTARRWRNWPRTARGLLAPFDRLLVQEERTADLMREIGVAPDRILVTGSLKEDTAPPGADPEALDALLRATGGRETWCAASTHAGEDEVALAAHEAVGGKTATGPLLILVPRHPDRGDAVARMAESAGWRLRRRSTGEMPDLRTQVYLADTLGEMGLWYRASPVAFIGGSLTEIGGHNPYEPVQLGCAVLFGPHVFNFRDIYDRLARNGGALAVADAASIARALTDLRDPGRRDDLAARARAALETAGRATAATQAEIEAALGLS